MRFSALLIGCGNIGLRYDLGAVPRQHPQSHAFALARHPGFQLVGLCEPDAARRKEAEKAFPDVRCFEVSDQAIAAVKPNLLVIATPSGIRRAPIEAGIATGARAILCEKPIALTRSEADVIVRRCRDVALLVNYSRRFDPAYAALGERIAANEFGALCGGSGRYVRGLANNGAHLLDLLDWWLGSLTLLSSDKGVEPASPFVQMQSRDKAIVSLLPVQNSEYDVFELELFFEKAAIRLADHGRRLTVELCKVVDFGEARLGVLGAPEALPVDPNGNMMRALDRLYDLMQASPEQRRRIQQPALDSALRATALFEQALS